MNKSGKKTFLHKNEQGYTLAIVLMVLLVFSVLGMSLLAMTMNSMRMSAGEREDQAVFYIAESGATIVLSEIEELVDTLSNSTSTINEAAFFTELESEIVSKVDPSSKKLITKKIESFELNQGEEPYAEVSVELVGMVADNSAREYKIVSDGKVGNRTRTVEGNFTISYQNGSSGIEIPNNLTLFTYSDIFNGEKITGDIATLSTNAKTIEVTNGSTVSGNIYVSENVGENALNMDSIGANDPARTYYEKKIKAIDTFNYHSITNAQLPSFPAIPSYDKHPDLQVPGSDGKKYNFIKDGDLHHTGARMNYEYKLPLSKNVSFNEFRVTDSKLIIDIGNKEISMVVDDFDVKGTIEIVGSGTLNIYIKDSITLGYGNINTEEKTKNLNFYISGPDNKTEYSTLHLFGSMQIFGSVFVDNVNLDLTAGSSIKGHVFSNGELLELTGGSSVGNTLIFAPKAEVRIDSASGQDLIGTIISNSYYGSGGAHIKYGHIDTTSIEFLSETGQSDPNILIDKLKFIEK